MIDRICQGLLYLMQIKEAHSLLDVNHPFKVIPSCTFIPQKYKVIRVRYPVVVFCLYDAFFRSTFVS